MGHNDPKVHNDPKAAQGLNYCNLPSNYNVLSNAHSFGGDRYYTNSYLNLEVHLFSYNAALLSVG